MGKVLRYDFKLYEGRDHIVMEGSFYYHVLDETEFQSKCVTLHPEISRRWRMIRKACPTTYASLYCREDGGSVSGMNDRDEWLSDDDKLPEGWEFVRGGLPNVGDWVMLPSDRSPFTNDFRPRLVEENSPLLKSYVCLIVRKKDSGAE
jgi:hypothetical protein